VIRRDPWFICARDASPEKKAELEKIGAKVIPVDVDERGTSISAATQFGLAYARITEIGEQRRYRWHSTDLSGVIPPSCLPAVLAEHGLQSVMVEGGSQILSSFLHEGDRSDGTPFVDSVIVTVAPTFIGEGIPLIYPVRPCPVSNVDTLAISGLLTGL
jgi:2,5-diamino-6-(ribosylamino)-4(3H)-pyrimidinone 5'-phosphate reductase